MVEQYLGFNGEFTKAVRQALSEANDLYKKSSASTSSRALRRLKGKVDAVADYRRRSPSGPGYDFRVAAENMANVLAQLSAQDYQKPQKILEALGPVAGGLLDELDRPVSPSNPWQR